MYLVVTKTRVYDYGSDRRYAFAAATNLGSSAVVFYNVDANAWMYFLVDCVAFNIG